MKKITLILAILGIGALIISFSTLEEMLFSSKEEGTGIPPKYNTAYQKIKLRIDEEIKDQTWSKVNYTSINEDIIAAGEGELLPEDLTKRLSHNLNLHYIPTVVKATKDFYANDCSNKKKLSPLHKELKRYAEGSTSNKEYKALVKEMRRVTIATYNAIGSGGVNGKIATYVTTDYNRHVSKDFKEDLNTFEAKKYLRECALVLRAIKKNKEKLDMHCYEFISKQVDDYITTPIDSMGYDETLLVTFETAVEEYQSANYRSDQTVVDEKANFLFDKIEGFRRDNKPDGE